MGSRETSDMGKISVNEENPITPKDMSDSQLLAWIDRATNDVKEASEQAPESEKHVTAFAGLMALVFEAKERGLHLKRMH